QACRQLLQLGPHQRLPPSLGLQAALRGPILDFLRNRRNLLLAHLRLQLREAASASPWHHHQPPSRTSRPLLLSSPLLHVYPLRLSVHLPITAQSPEGSPPPRPCDHRTSSPFLRPVAAMSHPSDLIASSGGLACGPLFVRPPSVKEESNCNYLLS